MYYLQRATTLLWSALDVSRGSDLHGAGADEEVVAMENQRVFKSLEATLTETQLANGIHSDAVTQLLATNFDAWRDQQEVLHFEAAQKILGPGRLVGFDIHARTVHIQLNGEAAVRQYSFAEISDFGPAQYSNPETMGHTLLGAYWEAKTTRRYLERMVANSYARY